MSRSPTQAAEYRAKLDRFAELLSLDIPLPQITERMGWSSGYTHKLLADLRAKYGWQAA